MENIKLHKKGFLAKLLHSIPVFESSTRMKMRIRIKCTSLLWKRANYIEKGFVRLSQNRSAGPNFKQARTVIEHQLQILFGCNMPQL